MQARLAAFGAATSLLLVPAAHAGGHFAGGRVAFEPTAALSWRGAVAVVARYFGPRVAAWELSCSRQGSEGGWGAWVLNTQGSGAGGWLQFMQGTFDGVIGKAIAAARSLGLAVPASARSWYSTLGQALAGAEMLREGRRDEWSGWGC